MTITSLDLLCYAESKGIYVEYGNLHQTGSCAVFIDNRIYVVGLDDGDMTEAQLRTHLAHEIGHCEAGAFYDKNSPLDNRAKDEHKANVWAIKKLLPKEELQQAFRQGLVEIWQLAEHFDLTEDIIRFACRYYFNKY